MENSKRGILYPYIQSEKHLIEKAESISFYGIRSVLCVPLLTKEKLLGMIYLDSQLAEGVFEQDDLDALNTICNQAAISIENAVMYERLREQIDFMQGAYNRLVETFRRSYPELTPEEPVPLGEDIMSELDTIADALVGSSEKLRALDELKSQFLSNVSHELYTPLTSIKGYADNLLDGVVGDLDENQRKYMERISQNCGRLMRMISDLLNLSRIEAGRIDFVPTKLLLSSVISEIVFELTPIADKKGVSLSFDCSSDVTLFADEDKLREIVINLLDNAIKFTPPEGDVSVCAEDKGECVDISVADTGIGMPRDSLNEIFERFQQAQRKDGGKSGGIGIGLAIVKSFVELHGGSVSVQSEQGMGTRFTVTLPRRESGNGYERTVR